MLIGAFIFLLAYYYFILRKYNTLGFRLFSLCFFVSAAMVYWWWSDWRELKKMEQEGITEAAYVLEKKQAGKDWLVSVQFTDEGGNQVTLPCDTGMSVEELAAVVPERPVFIRFRPGSTSVFLESSYQRRIKDNGWFLLFPAFFLLLGCTAWFFLRKYRVHAHEGTVYEYVTNEEGKVVLDDAANETTKGLKKANLMSKLMQLFMRN